MPTEAISTIRASGGDYTTLSAWEAGEQRNLVTADEIAVAVCYNDWPSGLNDDVTIAGWTTDATRYVKITVAEGHRHNGTPGTGFWMYKTGDFVRTVLSQTGFTQLEWLDLRNAATGTDANALALQGTTVATNMLLTCGSSRAVFSLSGGTLRSSLIYNGANGVLAAAFAAGTTENCVFANMTGYGVGAATSGGGPTIKNCVFWNTTMPSGEGSYAAASTNNASSSASGLPGANAVYNVTSAAFVDAASNDFHLSSGSVLRGAGVNLYSDFQTDIDGDTWPSSGAWDIGFDYYVAAGGSTQDLAGTGSSTATGAAAPAAQVALAGVGVSLATGTATAVEIALSALGLAVASGTAAVSGAASGELAAAGQVAAQGSAALAANVTISATGLAQAAATAGISAQILLAGAGAAQAAGNATLAAELHAMAAGAAQASGTATLSGAAAGQLSAGGQAQALGTAALVLDVRLQAAGAAQASGSAELDTDLPPPNPLAADGQAQASGAGTVAATVTLTGAGFVHAMGAGQLSISIALAAAGAGRATGAATLVPLGLVYSAARRLAVRAEHRRLTINAENRRMGIA